MPPLAYFVRHGQTNWNAQQRLQGQADVDVNDKGRAQAAANGRKLARLVWEPSAFDFVASPLRRTRETMEILRREMGLPAQGYRMDDRLVEVHFGDWQGFTYDELEQHHPGAARTRNRDKWHFVPPGAAAESYEMLTERVRPWFAALSRPTICVTHGGVMRTLFVIRGQADIGEAASMEIPQDRVLAMEEGRLVWR